VKSAVVAIGGNALIGAGERGTIDQEFAHARVIARDVAGMVARGWRVVLTHGNGPQVGFILHRSALTAALAPELPGLALDYGVAETQGGLGYVLGNSLGNALRRLGRPEKVVTVLTQTVVAADDPAFRRPTKPIGSFYSREEGSRLSQRYGWRMAEDSGRGYRRVVASPRPLRIVEAPAIASLLRQGFLVIAAGGGGVPVVEKVPGQLRGVEAVIDKDLASALLALELGAELLVLCTQIERVAINFGRPDLRFLDNLTLPEAEGYLAQGQFPAGSMGPKVQAAIEFLRGGGKEALITATDRLAEALAGGTGTRLRPGLGSPAAGPRAPRS